MPLTIWNCVLSYKQQNYFSENGLNPPRNYFHNRIARQQRFATQVFNRWQMGFSGGKFLTTDNFEPWNIVYFTIYMCNRAVYKVKTNKTILRLF